jgi:hypothetical protein
LSTEQESECAARVSRREFVAIIAQETAMDFQIEALKLAQFAHLIGLPDEALPAHRARRVVADSHPGYPCRVSLVDARIGESLLLVNYQHLDVDTPYRSGYAIYVREQADEAHPGINEIPPVLRTRLMSLRAMSAQGMLLAADVAEGAALAPAIEKLLADPQVDCLHLHNARPGCFAARVRRA